MIDGNKKCNCKLGFELQSLRVIERRCNYFAVVQQELLLPWSAMTSQRDYMFTVYSSFTVSHNYYVEFWHSLCGLLPLGLKLKKTFPVSDEHVTVDLGAHFNGQDCQDGITKMENKN